MKESAFEAFTLKAVMTMPALVLQKPNAKFKTHARSHFLSSSTTVTLGKGEIVELLKEGRYNSEKFTSVILEKG